MAEISEPRIREIVRDELSVMQVPEKTFKPADGPIPISPEPKRKK